jgi:hypothetical protein
MPPPANAPVHMVVDPMWQWVFGGLHFLVAAWVIYYSARTPVRQKDWRELAFRMTVLFSGAAGAIFFEPAVDRAVNLWYAEVGQWPLSQMWGISVPLWVAPVYLWFIGGGALVIVDRIRKGGTTRDYLYIFGGIAVADLLLEVPIIKIAGLYTYYGENQPFFDADWFPLPLWLIFTNRVFDLLPALMLIALMSFRSKWVIAAVPVLMLGSCYMSYGLVTWPTVYALHNGASPLVAHLAATYTIVVATLFTVAGARMAPRLRHLMDHHRPDGRRPGAGAEEPAPALVSD